MLRSTSFLLLLLYITSALGLTGNQTQCKPDQFRCKSGNCVALGDRCDHMHDCPDGSDEEGCGSTTCSDGYFRCKNGKCIPDRWKCDGLVDCEDAGDGDNSDEPANCPKECAGFVCEGTNECISNDKNCDGVKDCARGDDEMTGNCESQDLLFHCDNQNSIDNQWKCDGHDDCGDGSDEKPAMCSKCGEEHFKCLSGECVTKKWVCDGENDCDDSSDEKNCPIQELLNQTCDSNMFRCHTSIEPTCIAEAWKCDGDEDCHDGSDEENCPVNKECSNDEKRCDSGLCLRAGFWCDGDDDCGDNSDENNCSSPVTAAPTCAVNQFDCKKDGSKCISDTYICDGNNDCGHFEDEANCPTKDHNSCRGDHNGGCQQICVPLGNTRVCECKVGYEKVPGSETDCQDINECLVPGTCSQICINTKSSYKCECEDGYILSDHRSCKANSGTLPAELIFTDSYDIRRYELDTYHYTLLMDKENLAGAVTVDYDYRNKMIYWAGIDTKGYTTANLETGEMSTTVSNNVKVPDGLAVDWVHGNLYMSDTGLDHIIVFKLNHDYSKVVVSGNLDEPRAVVIDPYHGWMYFTDWGSEPKIEKCGMNGKERKVIVTEHIVWPNGLAIDYVDGRLYWVDAKLHHIGSTDLEGADYRMVLKAHRHLGHPFAITVFEDYVYWTDWIDNAVHKVNKFGIGNITTIAFDLKTPYDIRVYHIYRQPKRINHCGDNYGGCSHLCLPAPQITEAYGIQKRSECACPDGMVLQADGYNCITDGAVTVKPPTPSKPSQSGDENRPRTPKVKPATTVRPKTTVKVQPTAAGKSKQTTEKSEEVTVHYRETTEKPHKDLNGTHLQQTDNDESPAMGMVAIVAIAVVIVVVAVLVGILFFVVKRYKNKNVRSMNFDNPVYRKTTTDDQLIMDRDSRPERESMQPLNQDAEIV